MFERFFNHILYSIAAPRWVSALSKIVGPLLCSFRGYFWIKFKVHLLGDILANYKFNGLIIHFFICNQRK